MSQTSQMECLSCVVIFLTSLFLVVSAQDLGTGIGQKRNDDTVAVHAGKIENQKPKKKDGGIIGMKISESDECMEDVKRFCPGKGSSNNFLVLDCLQDDEKTGDKVSNDCQNLIWHYKKNLTEDLRFDHASKEACSHELENISECNQLPKGQGLIIPCLIEHYEDIKSKPCSAFLNKMAGIIFSDYRFMKFFLQDCQADIQSKRCGRLENTVEDTPHFQGFTVGCLNQHRKNLTKKCKKSLLKVAELQSDDYHLDRPLYYACKNDREALCPDVAAGDGAVFKCLYSKIADKMMSENCREKLENRQELISEDVKVDRSFYEACSEDIRENNCIRKHSDNDGTVEQDLSRSSILLCLENAQNGEQGKKVKPKCLQEMFEMRSELMQDYKISPELVSACEQEISQHCNGLQLGGKTIHCLMKKSMRETKKKKDNEDRLSSQCTAELAKLLNIANPGEDIRLDEPLQRSCGEVVTSACSDRKAGHGDIITCLLENLDHEDMTDECEDHLLEIQYFAVRDFKLDHHLFKECRRDAVKLCHSDGYQDPDKMEPEQGPLIFSCLHRLSRTEEPNVSKPSRRCLHEIHRVMRERGTRVQLLPEVEAKCIKDLSDLCSEDDEHTEVGAEMACLQENLESLSGDCNEVVSKFTEEETEDIQMDRILMKACTPMIKKFCAHLLETDAMPTEVLDCLIQHKNYNEMDEKCAAGIEHHQIISLTDFRFNHKFREACQGSVGKYCKHRKTKYDVVACLSEIVRNDTLMDQDPRIDKPCRKQLKAEILQRGESINLDPELKEKCASDIEELCNNKKKGEGEITECLRNHKKKLSDECHKLLFKREKDEAEFGDYTLIHTCRKMIEEHCDLNGDEEDILECLKEKSRSLGSHFDDRCRKIIIRRQVEQSRDFRLNPHLRKACRDDIPKFCKDLFAKSHSGKEMEGEIINCLKRVYAKSKMLSRDCEHEIKSIIKEEAVDINQNPVIMKLCKEDIRSNCLNVLVDMGMSQQNEDDEIAYNENRDGGVIECLKNKFQSLKNLNCKEEIAFLIAESRVDVHTDPLLQAACQKDLISICKSVPQGQGRQMSCLLAHLDSNPGAMTRQCKTMVKQRKDLWEYAAQVAPAESLSEIYDQMAQSPSRNYFFAVLFTIVGVILIVGITCGRVTKRVSTAVKNK